MGNGPYAGRSRGGERFFWENLQPILDEAVIATVKSCSRPAGSD